jgi:8-oxo-dGTP pyrophosphatase MutT (NUDIX family)
MPVEPTPAASVILVRAGGPNGSEPIEAYVIRRHTGMRFLGGYYAFPGGKVDSGDATGACFLSCHGLTAADAEAIVPTRDGIPALAYWVTAVRELWEETGVLFARDDAGHPVDPTRPEVREAIDRGRTDLIAGTASLAELLARAAWRLDVAPLRYLSHFITPAASPIRFSARFFLCPLPAGQAPRLFVEETSEGFWVGPADGRRRFQSGELPMAEPAEYALGYLAQFDTLDAVWEAHADLRHKFHGIIDRSDLFYGGEFDATGRPTRRRDWG